MAKAGRPTKMTPERVAIICKSIASGDPTQTACKLAGISDETFSRWLDNVEFAEAIKKAKKDFEEWEMNGILETAKRGLKKLLEGEEYEEVTTEYVNDDKGNPTIRKQTRKTKKIPPSATATIFALCNRDPDGWKNRISNEISGKIDTDTETNISLKEIPDDLLAQVIESIKGN